MDALSGHASTCEWVSRAADQLLALRGHEPLDVQVIAERISVSKALPLHHVTNEQPWTLLRHTAAQARARYQAMLAEVVEATTESVRQRLRRATWG